MQQWLLRTHSHVHIHESRHFIEGVREVSDTCSEASGFQTLRGDDVIDVLPNKWNRQRHKTLEKHPLALSQTKHARECEGQSNNGIIMAATPDQSRRSVTEGSSSASSDSMLAV